MFKIQCCWTIITPQGTRHEVANMSKEVNFWPNCLSTSQSLLILSFLMYKTEIFFSSTYSFDPAPFHSVSQFFLLRE